VSAFINRFAWPCATLLAWLLAWWHLSAEWSADEQYRYGFGVPFLAAWMSWRRFHGPMTPAPRRPAWWCVVAIALLALALGAALRRHDPLWRFTGATLTAGAALLWLAWLHRRGGRPLVRRQLFPLLFAAIAVPWPMPVELWMVRHLAAAVTDVATFTANLLGVAALQHGNTIELAKGVVGVDEACSGIQSFQATLMSSLFLGEFFSLRTPGRVALAIAGGAISFLVNCGRVLTLTLLTHSRGQHAAMEWHDTVGGSATAVAFALVLAAAFLLARGRAAVPAAPSPSAPIPMPEGTAIFVIVLAIPLAAHAWFSRFEKADAASGKALRWTLSDRHLPAGWTSEYVAPSKTVRIGLRFSEWQSFQLRNPDGATAQVIHLAWKPGTRLPSFVTNHTPAICMPAAGWVQSGPPALLTLEVRGASLPGVTYPFTREGARLLVFQSMSAGGQIEQRFVDPTQIPGGFQRLANLWHAPLRQISEELLLYLPDPGDTAPRKSAASAVLEAVLARDAN
jgi:exosortase